MSGRKCLSVWIWFSYPTNKLPNWVFLVSNKTSVLGLVSETAAAFLAREGTGDGGGGDLDMDFTLAQMFPIWRKDKW